MRLALVAAVSISTSSSSRSDWGQYGSRDLDHIRRTAARGSSAAGAVDRSQAIGKQRLGRVLDVMHQALEDVVKQRDLVVRKIDRAIDEEIGDAAQRFDPACTVSVASVAATRQAGFLKRRRISNS